MRARGEPPRKNFKLKPGQIEPLVSDRSGCLATDLITVEGMRVGFMYREEPSEPVDSGWRFLAGVEDQQYMDDPENHGVYSLNTIANYDREIIPLLESPVGSAFERHPITRRFVPCQPPESLD
jgi:hypothetical protein